MAALIIKRKIPWLPANRYETTRKRNLGLDLCSQRVLKFHASEITRVSFNVLLLLTPDKNVKMTSDVILTFLSDVRISYTAIMHSLCRIWSLDARKPIIGFCEQIRLIQASSPTEPSYKDLM